MDVNWGWIILFLAGIALLGIIWEVIKGLWLPALAVIYLILFVLGLFLIALAIADFIALLNGK